jgi:tetratricopeptide (TPR) repeat protein
MVRSRLGYIERAPNLIDNYMVRGLICKEQGKIDEAIADFEKLITLTSDP